MWQIYQAAHYSCVLHHSSLTWLSFILQLFVPPPRTKIITSQADQASPAAKRVTQVKVMFDVMGSTVKEPFIGTKISPIWLTCTGPIQLSFSPVQKPHTWALAKREPLIIQRLGRYQNDQHDEKSLVVPKLAPYDCPIQASFCHCWTPFRFPIQPCTGIPFKEDNLPILNHKIHQNVHLNTQSNIHSLRSSKHSQQSSQPKVITQKEKIEELHGDVFEGIRHFPGKPYHINSDESVAPVQTQYRPVLLHLKEVFNQEVNKMLNASILNPVEKATPCINSFILVEDKNPDGSIKLRICLDPPNLNKVVICEH